MVPETNSRAAWTYGLTPQILPLQCLPRYSKVLHPLRVGVAPELALSVLYNAVL